jgi:hypothetical protein
VTVAQLVVEIEARNRSLKSVLSDSTRGVNAFVREIENANKKIAAMPVAMDRWGRESEQGRAIAQARIAQARELSNEIIKGYRESEKQLRGLLRSGAISNEEFVARGRALAESTVKGAREKFEQFRGALGTDVANALVGSLELGLAKASAAAEKGARNINQVQRALNDLDAGQTRALGDLDRAIGEGHVAAAERTLRRAEVIAQRNEALIRKINEMEAKGQMRPALREAALTKLDPRGFGFGVSRTEAEKAFQDAQRQIGSLQQRMQAEIAKTKLDLAAGLDPRLGEQRIAAAYQSMNQGIQHGRTRLEQAKLLTPEIERLLSGSLVKVPKVKPDLSPVEQSFLDVQRQVGRLRERMQTDIARTKLDLLAGLDPRVGEQRIAAAYEAMNRGLAHGRARLDQAKLLTPEIERFLSGQIVRAPKAAAPVNEAFANAERQIASLQERMQQSIARNKIDVAAGLDPQIAARRVALAKEELNKGLVDMRNQIVAQAGKIAPEIENLISKAVVKVPTLKPQDVQETLRHISTLRQRMEAEIAKTRLDISAGLDPQLGARRIAASAERMNQGIEQLRQRIKSSVIGLSSEVENVLSKAIVKVPKIPPADVEAAVRSIKTLQERMKGQLAAVKLDVAAGLDPQEGARRMAAVKQNMNREIENLRRNIRASSTGLSTEVEQLLAKAVVKVPTVSTATEDQIKRTFDLTKKQIQNQRNIMQSEIARTKLDLTAGLIDPKAAQARINTAFNNFKTAIETGRQRMVAGKSITGEIEQEMSKALDSAERLVRRQTPKVFDAQTQLARDGVQKFVTTYNRAIADAKLKTTTGELDAKGFTRAANQAKAAFNRSLDDLRRDLDGKGILTPTAIRLIDSQFKRAGEIAANSFSSKIAEGMVKAGQSLKSAGQQLLQFLTLPIGGALLGAGKLAAEYEAAAGRVSLVFGPALGKKVQDSLKALRAEIPATSIEVQNFAARVGEVFLPLGVIPERADRVKEGVAGMTLEFIKLTKALVVLNPGTTAERAFSALLNATVGRTTELGKLGIFVRQAAIDARALQYANDELNKSMETSGKIYRRTSADLSPRERAMGAYLLILERGALIEKAIAFQQNNFNLQLEFTKKAMIEAGVAAGTILLPVMKELAKAVQDLFVGFQRLPKETLESAVQFAKWAALLGPAILALGTFLSILGKVGVALKAVGAATGIGAPAVALGGLLGPLAALGGIVATVAYAWKLYKEAQDAATQSAFNYAEAIGSMDLSQLTQEQGNIAEQLSALAVEQARLMDKGLQEYDRRTAGALQHAKGTKTRAALEEQISKNRKPIFVDESDEQALNRVTARIMELDRNMESVGHRMVIARTELDKVKAQQEDWNKKMREFQEIAAQETLKQRLAREREEWETLNKEIALTVAQLRLGRRLGSDLTEPLARAREQIGKVDELLGDSNATKSRIADLQKLGIALQLAIAGPKETGGADKALSREMKLFSLDVRVAIANLNETAAAGRDIEKPLERVKELAADFAARLERIGIDPAVAKQFALWITQLEAAARKAQLIDISGVSSQVSLQVDQLRDLTQRMDTASGQERVRLTEDLFLTLAEVAQTENQISLMIGAGLVNAKQRNQLQERYLELKRAEITANRELIDSVDIFLPGLKESLERQSDRLKGAQATLDIQLRIPNNQQAIEEAKRDISRIQKEIGEAIQSAMGTGLFKFLDETQQAEVLRVLDDVMKKLAIDGQTFNEELEKTDKILDRISIGLRGIGEVFEAFGVESKNARELVRNANLAVDAFKQIRAAQESRRRREASEDPFDMTKPFHAGFDFAEMTALVSGLFGAIGSVVGIIGSIRSLFGKTERQSEHDAILEKNNERLAEMTSELSKFSLTIGNQTRVQRALSDPNVRRAIATRQFIESQSVAFGAGARGKAREDVERELKRFGLSMADINRVAKENGITLLDKNGRIVAGAFEQLVAAIAMTREAFFDYSDTLADLTTKTDLYNDVFNVEDTGQQVIRDQLAMFETLAPDLFKEFFAGIDLTDAAAVEAALQSLTTALLNGTLEASETLKLMDRGELERIILGVAGGLDKLRDATDNMTESMLNVPEWFKVNQVRFESVGPIETPTLPPKAPEQDGPFTPSVPGPPGGVRPTAQYTGPVTNNFNIVQQPGEDGEALARRVVDMWRTETFLRTGESTTPFDN